MTRPAGAPPAGAPVALALALLLAAAACNNRDEVRLEGERIPVFEEESTGLDGILLSLGFDEGPMELPARARRAPWPQDGGSAGNAPGRLSLPPLEALEPAWRVSFGRPGSVMPPPVVSGGRVFAFDGGREVRALSSDDGSVAWEARLAVGSEDAAGAFGGGVAVDDGRVFVAGGSGLVHALSAADGSPLWSARLGEPMRAPPAVAGGRVFLVTLSNRTVALSAEDGAVLWTHSGSPERVFVAYSAGAAIQGSDVIVPHSSGEFLALVAETGRELWAASAGSDEEGGGVALGTPAPPVLDAGEAFLLGPGGFTALRLSTGDVLWEVEIPGASGPWLAGTHVFVTEGSSLLALERTSGAVRWIVPIGPEGEGAPARGRRSEAAVWRSPRLVEEGLLVVSSEGGAAVFDPDTGEAVARRPLRDGASSAPVVGEGMLVYATGGGGLVALRLGRRARGAPGARPPPEGEGSVFRIAVAGRPNVGKSALFNLLAGRRIAIVEGTPGVTRDWMAAPARVAGRLVELRDTAGLDSGSHPRGSLEAAVAARNLEACRESDLIWFVVDARAGALPEDEAILRLLRRLNRPILLVANKCEAARDAEAATASTAVFGLGEPVRVSAAHGLGLDDLAEATAPLLPPDEPSPGAGEEGAAPPPGAAAGEGGDDGPPTGDAGEGASPPNGDGEEGAAAPPAGARLAVVGRPNVGKSTLVNALLGEERMLVAARAGTTRDAVAVNLPPERGGLRLVDTAGLRRRSRVVERLEQLSGLRSLEALERADQVWLVLDAERGMERQDLLLASRVLEEGRALLLVLNKVDLVPTAEGARLDVLDRAARSLSQGLGTAAVSVSALEGRGLDELLAASRDLHARWCSRVPTGRLNRWLAEATAERPPPAPGGRRISFRYATQHKARPPSFMLSCSQASSVPPSYLRYLEKSLARAFSLEGVPLRLTLRSPDNPWRRGAAPRRGGARRLGGRRPVRRPPVRPPPILRAATAGSEGPSPPAAQAAPARRSGARPA